MDAMQRGDVEAVVALLAQDAAWSMPPMATWYRGHDALRVFLANGPLSGQWQWRRMPTFVNGQPAVGAYTWWEEEQIYLPFALDVLTVSGEQIQEVTSFIARSGEGLSPHELARFPTQPPDQAKVEAIFVRSGLPSRLD
jgi:RNA polymerase sigma-70 factor (ECF subfamily)